MSPAPQMQKSWADSNEPAAKRTFGWPIGVHPLKARGQGCRQPEFMHLPITSVHISHVPIGLSIQYSWFRLQSGQLPMNSSLEPPSNSKYLKNHQSDVVFLFDLRKGTPSSPHTWRFCFCDTLMASPAASLNYGAGATLSRNVYRPPESSRQPLQIRRTRGCRWHQSRKQILDSHKEYRRQHICDILSDTCACKRPVGHSLIIQPRRRGAAHLAGLIQAENLRRDSSCLRAPVKEAARRSGVTYPTVYVNSRALPTRGS
jgi:hypothetical protein